MSFTKGDWFCGKGLASPLSEEQAKALRSSKLARGLMDSKLPSRDCVEEMAGGTVD